MSPAGSRGRSAEIHVAGPCGLACAPCDCRAASSDRAAIARAVSAGSSRLVLRGGTEGRSALVAEARRQGVGDVVVRTHAHDLVRNDGLAALGGADAILVPLFAHTERVHDAIARRPSALVASLVGMRAASSAGVAVEIEIPILSPRVQSLAEIVKLAGRAVPLRAIRLYLPNQVLPQAIAPPRIDAVGLALEGVAQTATELAARLAISPPDLVPPCAAADRPHLLARFSLDRTARARSTTFAPACDGCALRTRCPGLAASYVAAHGREGVRAFPAVPLALTRRARRRTWTEAERKAASRARMVVLRPTVHCNQDCTFCSANESSANVWTDPGEMLRAIARAARRGVRHLSFGGGEPTLSRHLPDFVRAASRTGISTVEIVTNGVLLDDPRRVDALRAAGLTNAFVSLHAHDEQLSQVLTQKVGDFPRTLRAIGLLANAGIETVVNHVITAPTYRYLPRFVELMKREASGRVRISFAFVTPQFKALENADVMPKISDVMPFLRRAAHRAIAIGQPFEIGSRQGIPPCFLGELQGWSDIAGLADNATAEDAHQKVRGPGCDTCRYSEICTGVWKPYAQRFGVTELRPVVGPPFEREVIAAAAQRLGAGPPRSFEDVPDEFRDRSGEAEALALGLAVETIASEERSRVHLPVVSSRRSRPLRAVLAGSGRQARRLLSAAASVPTLSFEAIASPHAPDLDPHEFDQRPLYASVQSALDDLRPEALVIAAATQTHFELARLAVERKIPVLVEKPITRTDEEAAQLIDLARDSGVTILPAHAVLFAPGLDTILARGGEGPVSYVRRTPSSSADAPRAWGRGSLSQTLHHALTLTGAASGGGLPEVVAASFVGDHAPEKVRLQVRYPRAMADLEIDFRSAVDLTSISVGSEGSVSTWRREGRHAVLVVGGQTSAITERGGETERMLDRFVASVVRGERFGSSVEDAFDVLRATRLAIDALAAAGAPFERPGAPKHVASPALRPPA